MRGVRSLRRRDLTPRVLEGIIVRQSSVMDWNYVNTQLAQLAELKEAPELVDKLEHLRRSIERERGAGSQL